MQTDVTGDELRQEADAALEIALSALALDRFEVRFSVAVRNKPNGPLEWARATIPEILARELSGDKDLFFSVIRGLVETVKPAAVAFTSRADQYKSTEAAKTLAPDQFIKFVTTRGTKEALRRGWVTCKDILSITVQSPDEMLIVSQELVNGRYANGAAEYRFAPKKDDPIAMRMRLY
jgi:hypothetical protein